MKPDALKKELHGVLVVMTTPFKDNFELDEKGLRKQTHFLMDNGIVRGTGILIPTGSNGECPMLADEERRRIWEIVLEESNGKISVMAGCNHTDTRAVIRMAKAAEEAGIDGLMISPPYYWAPVEDVILNHFRHICKETSLGIMVYNNWFASQVDISIETMGKLAELPNIIALKEGTPHLNKLFRMVNALGDKIVMINGIGEPHEPFASLMGTPGFVSGLANLMPRTILELARANKKGEYDKSQDINRKIFPLIDFISCGKSFGETIGRLKAAMDVAGLPAGPPRLPYIAVDEREKKKLRGILGKLDILDKLQL